MYSVKKNCAYTNISIYADDLALWKSGANAKYIYKKIIQLDINNIITWSIKHDIKISLEKTKFIIFSQKKKIRNVNLHIEKQEIERVDTFKFLGIHFGSSLSWKIHIENIVSRCFSSLNMLRAITGSSWGANNRTLLLFYKQYIRPVIEYGSELFNKSSTFYTKKKLDSVYNTKP